MDRNALRDPQITPDAKIDFGATCPGAHFVESVLVPPEREKKCFDVLRPRRTGIHYVAHIPHQMQKHKFDVICSSVLFVKSVLVPPE
jgi:hypothetical protein